MQIVVELATGTRHLDVRFGDDALVGELVEAVFGADAGSGSGLVVDGRTVPLDAPLRVSGVGAGSVLSLSPSARSRSGTVALQVLTGPAAGASVELPAGRYLIGSGADVDVALRAPGVRARHAEFVVAGGGSVDVRPIGGPVSPLPVGSVVRLGGCLIECVPVAAVRTDCVVAPGRRGTVGFNRPPRRLRRDLSLEVALPSLPTPPATRPAPSVVAIATPLLFGAAMAVLVHPRLALFALLGPAMLLGTWIEGKRRRRGYARELAAAVADGRSLLGAALDRARARALLRSRAAIPSVATLAQWARPSARLWERRPEHEDFMRLAVGYGSVPWEPPLGPDLAEMPLDWQALVAARSVMPVGVAPVDLRATQVLGVAGARAAALSLARGLICQAVALHGPADLRVAVVSAWPDDWDWVKWTPHTLTGSAGRRLLASSPEERTRLVELLSAAAPPAGVTRPPGAAAAPLTLLVVDLPDLEQPASTGLRRLLAGGGAPVAGLVVAADAQRLPSTCTIVADAAGNHARLVEMRGEAVTVAAAAATAEVAERLARRLARLDDPDVDDAGAELPETVALVGLLGDVTTPEALLARWRSVDVASRLEATIGVTEAGPLRLDLVADGPHALLAGTTGSGKSELLRTLVASLACTAGPEHLTFVLIDYKGGSAFDACATLPHTVGVVTDLDDSLAARALRCLEAELRYREQRLRDAGADDLAAYLVSRAVPPLPRMLIVVDEFAALARELPDFMDSLVDIAARGRSLGVHLVLATQRPAGVIRDNVRANTNLRIALRVQDRTESADVVGDPRAAAIGRAQAGRGFVRLGPGEVVPFQAALATRRSHRRRSAVQVREFVFAMEPAPFVDTAERAEAPATDLEGIVAAACEAARVAGFEEPRRPWPDPLPVRLPIDALDMGDPPTPWAIPLGLVDEPDRQRQRTWWWDAGASLALYGVAGAGTSTTLATVALQLMQRASPAELHLYVLDFDAGALAPLAAAGHVGAVVLGAERERQVRLVRHLASELDRRKARVGASLVPRIVVMIDNYAGFAASYDAAVDAPIREALQRVLTEGPAVGIVAVVSGNRHSAIPLAVAATIERKLIYRMADPLAAAALGVRRIPADLPAGRAIEAVTGRHIQIARSEPDGIAAAVAALPDHGESADGPSTIEALPHVVKTEQISPAATILDSDWFLPVGIGDRDLAPVGFKLGPGDHVLVAGARRSGRSNVLSALASTVEACREDVAITAIALGDSSLREVAAAKVVTVPAAVEEILEAVAVARRPHLVLIDDAETVESGPALRSLLESPRIGLHVVAAGLLDLKSDHRHWTKALRRSRIGLWLKPEPGLDGDLWSTPMPRRVPAGMPAGRGYLVSQGGVELVQTAVR